MAGKAAVASSSKSKGTQAANSRRSFFVFAALAGSLTVTGLGLKLLSPPPVRAPDRLFATQRIEEVTSKFNKDWGMIYIRQSKTRPTDVELLDDTEMTDHFVVRPTLTGETEVLVSPRWKRQLPALPPQGASSLPEDCISICIAGDFDRTQPGFAQVQRLTELVTSLQTKHEIRRDKVFWMPVQDSPVGIGKLFPADTFRARILP